MLLYRSMLFLRFGSFCNAWRAAKSGEFSLGKKLRNRGCPEEEDWEAPNSPELLQSPPTGRKGVLFGFIEIRE